MNRRMLDVLAAVVVAAALVVSFVHADQAHHAAGNMAAKPGMNPSREMQQMMAEMMKCEVCSNLAVHMDVLGPVMKNEATPLTDGMTEMHTITDLSKLQLFRDSCAAMHKAGARMSVDDTRNGTLMVLTSSDPAVKAQIDGLITKCAMMNNM